MARAQRQARAGVLACAKYSFPSIPPVDSIVAEYTSFARGFDCPDADGRCAWAEGTLWVGHYRERRIYQVEPESGAILRTIESNRFVTGVTWVDGELWHATWEGEESELRRIAPQTGEVLECVEMPPGVGISGLESDGGERFFCGGGNSGKVRAVRRPRSAAS